MKRWIAFQCDAVCCSVLQRVWCIAVCCSVFGLLQFAGEEMGCISVWLGVQGLGLRVDCVSLLV